jgi:hypothetical protein
MGLLVCSATGNQQNLTKVFEPESALTDDRPQHWQAIKPCSEMVFCYQGCPRHMSCISYVDILASSLHIAVKLKLRAAEG